MSRNGARSLSRQLGAGRREAWRGRAFPKLAGRVLQRSGPRKQTRCCHHALLLPHQTIWVRRAPHEVSFPPARVFPNPVRSLEMGRVWAPAFGLQTKEFPPRPQPPPSAPASLISALRSPKPLRGPRFPYLRTGARGYWHHEQTRGTPRAGDPERDREAERLNPLSEFPELPFQGSWGREEMGGRHVRTSKLPGRGGGGPLSGLGEGLALRGKL